MEENAGTRLELRFGKTGILSGIFPELIGRNAVGGELQPVTVNVKLNYRGIMMRQRRGGKMKTSSYSSRSKAGEDGSLQRL